jgi:hypothetical protein
MTAKCNVLEMINDGSPVETIRCGQVALSLNQTAAGQVEGLRAGSETVFIFTEDQIEREAIRKLVIYDVENSADSTGNPFGSLMNLKKELSVVKPEHRASIIRAREDGLVTKIDWGGGAFDNMVMFTNPIADVDDGLKVISTYGSQVDSDRVEEITLSGGDLAEGVLVYMGGGTIAKEALLSNDFAKTMAVSGAFRDPTGNICAGIDGRIGITGHTKITPIVAIKGMR